MAILCGKQKDVERPSNDEALEKFEKAAEKLGIEVEMIDRDDFARLAEFAMHFGGEFHVTHGEANYCFLVPVFTTYANLRPEGGRLEILARTIKDSIGVREDANMPEVFEALGILLNRIGPRKPLRRYGITEEQLPGLVRKVYETQQRLLRCNYVEMTEKEFLEIYRLAY